MRQFLFLLFIAILAGVTTYAAVRFFRTHTPFKSYVVQSGSMEPTIRVGDIIIIAKHNSYQLNEVITFKDENKHTITHRITAVRTTQPPSYTTKGDANQTPDTETISLSQIVGTVILVIPKFGYVVQFIRTPWGFILTIIVPAVLLLSDEIKSLYKALR